MAKIIHHRKKCIGCGVCEEQQPEMWRMSKKDGKATLIRAKEKNQVFVLQIPEENILKSRSTARACPVRIISVV